MLKKSRVILLILATGALAGIALFGNSSEAQSPATITFTYDSLGRLVGEGYANYSGAKTLTYTYDKAANRTLSKIQ